MTLAAIVASTFRMSAAVLFVFLPLDWGKKTHPLQMKICIAFALFSFKSLLEFHLFSKDHNPILSDMERHA